MEGKRLGINPSRIYEWISLYQSLGEDGLITTSKKCNLFCYAQSKCCI